jgi:hypothetical protein
MNSIINSKILTAMLAGTIVLVLTSCLSGGSSSGSEGATGPGSPTGNTCTSVSYEAPSGAANNIVFTFDKAYTCGQFANGDWWVSEDSSGFVNIVSITPVASGGRNGYEVNPSNTNLQAFDNTAEVPYDASLMPALPLRLSGVSSVVKAVSILAAGRPQLRFAAVLTVVDAPIANSTEVFRPAYFGATKTFYNTSAIRVASIPKYNATGLPSVAGFPISKVASRHRHVQLDHYNSWAGRDMHPADNMADYGAEIATNNAESLLRLLLSDFNYSDSVHRQALINYLQMGIDLEAMAKGGNIWPPNGGHASGRKLPLVFAAWAFNNSNFSNAVAASVFAEDRQVWRSPVTGKALFGYDGGVEFAYWQSTVSSDGGLDTASQTGASDVRDPYGYIDGGGYEVGGSYQFCCTSKPWKYTVLALYMLDLEAAWGNGNILIDYVERWVTSGAIAGGNALPGNIPDPCAPYDGNPANYTITYGPNPLIPGQCITGTGRWPANNGIGVDGGLYDSAFGEELWDYYKALPP